MTFDVYSGAEGVRHIRLGYVNLSGKRTGGKNGAIYKFFK